VAEKKEVLRNAEIEFDDVRKFGAFPIESQKLIISKKESDLKPALMKYITSPDYMVRYALTGMFHATNGDLVTTDGHKMVIVKNASDKSGKIKDAQGKQITKKDDGRIIEGDEYPDYQSVIDKYDKRIGTFTTEELNNITKSAFSHYRNGLFTVQIGEQFFMVKKLRDVTEFLKKAGVKEVDVNISSEKDNDFKELVGHDIYKSIQFKAEGLGREIEIILMPYQMPYQTDEGYEANFILGKQ
jgi:hypothetical protein